MKLIIVVKYSPRKVTWQLQKGNRLLLRHFLPDIYITIKGQLKGPFLGVRAQHWRSWRTLESVCACTLQETPANLI